MKPKLPKLPVLLLGLVVAVAFSAAPPRSSPRHLTAEQQKEIARHEQNIATASPAGRFEEAEQAARQIATLRERWQGKAHWETANARLKQQKWQRMATLPAKDRPSAVQGLSLASQGADLHNRQQFAEAAAKYREALTI